MGFQFNPVNGLNDASQFPSKDSLARQHLQALIQQIPTYYDSKIVSSLATNGYRYNLDGSLEQWGTATIPSTAINANGTITVTLPLAYLADNFNISATITPSASYDFLGFSANDENSKSTVKFTVRNGSLSAQSFTIKWKTLGR